MHGSVGGWYEIRLTGPGRAQFRLFCLLENGTGQELAGRGLPRPAIAVITGMRKPWRAVFAERDHPACTGTWHRAPAELPAPHCDLTSPSAGAGYRYLLAVFRSASCCASRCDGPAQHGVSGDRTR